MTVTQGDKVSAGPASDEWQGARSAGGPNSGPFQPARAKRKRLKLFTWGESGAGKTTLALRFPRPVVIDLESGTDLYGGKFDFAVLHASTPAEVDRAVTWLGENRHPYQTLIVDPITIYWEALQRQWSDIFLRRNRGARGHKFEFYELGPREWLPIKAELKDLLRRIVALDMHVVVTARSKPQYADGGFMRVIGETFDGEKSLPYIFDVVLRLFRDRDGRFLGEVVKDRTGRLPMTSFESCHERLQELLGENAASPEASRASGTQAVQQNRQQREE